jgi:RNA polymerase sigma factor for flagellar operon FliA
MHDAAWPPDRRGWIEEYAPLVKQIAHYMMARLPASVEMDDIVQAGMMGLLDAITRYEEEQGAQFETYAAQRIRGAILDELRVSDWLSRGARRESRRVEAAISALEQRHGRLPLQREIAEAMKVPLTECQRMLQHARLGQVLHYEDFAEPDDEHFLDAHVSLGAPGILDELVDSELRARMSSAVRDLPEREQLVMSLYYEKDLNLREIGKVLGVTESRVCQIHTRALARLRATMRQW